MGEPFDDVVDRRDRSAWPLPAAIGHAAAERRRQPPLLKRAGITKRVSVHGLRRTFNNLSRQVAGNIVTRAITGHVTEEMTEHYSHVDRAEELRVADQVVALAGLRAPANDVTAPNAPARGGSGGGLN